MLAGTDIEFLGELAPGFDARIKIEKLEQVDDRRLVIAAAVMRLSKVFEDRPDIDRLRGGPEFGRGLDGWARAGGFRDRSRLGLGSLPEDGIFDLTENRHRPCSF